MQPMLFGLYPTLYDAAMMGASFEHRRNFEHMDRQQLEQHQLQRFNRLLERILPHNRFYAQKMAGCAEQLQSLDQLAALPFTVKDELLGEDAGGYAANLTYPLQHYVRFHRTSGTRGRPMAVLDTAEDWRWWIDTWQYVLDAAEVGPDDRAVLAFSFGPFIGFWSAFDAVVARGAMAIPSGGMSTLARLELIRSCRATVIFGTPTYALHMAEVAADHHQDLASLDVQRVVVAGEPGGSIASVRENIQAAWNATVIDHSGASEIGPWGFADLQQRGLHVIESEFLAEFLSIETGQPAEEGDLSELVLTTLGRAGSPVIRYRTGDLVRPLWPTGEANRFVLLDGGVLGRSDDMMIIRGVNIFPSSIEHILRSFSEVVEYRMTAFKRGEMDALRIEVEDRLNQPERIARQLQLQLGMRVEVEAVAVGTLPRFEAKGRRFVDQR